MSNYNQKKQNVKNQVNAENVEQDIENSGKLHQSINAKSVQIGNKPVSCPKCKTSNKRTDKFCKKCGQSLTNLCLTCWTENDLSTVFCTSCGTEVRKSKFGISPQLTQKWIEKFAEFGWHRRGQVGGTKTLPILERMGQPVNQHETLILEAGILYNTRIYKISVAGKEFRADIVHQKKTIGGIDITNQRIIVYNYVDGWIASYPHEYLSTVSTYKGESYMGDETFAFSLGYKNLGEINIYRTMPSMLQPRGVLARMTSSDFYNTQMDLQTTMVNTTIVRRIQEAQDENSVFTNFFQSIIELQQSFHQNKQGFTSNLSAAQVIQDAPGIKLPPDDDSCAPKAATMLLVFIGVISLITKWFL